MPRDETPSTWYYMMLDVTRYCLLINVVPGDIYSTSFVLIHFQRISLVFSYLV